MNHQNQLQTQAMAPAASPLRSQLLELAAVLGYLAAVAGTVTLTAIQVARILVVNLESVQMNRFPGI